MPPHHKSVFGFAASARSCASASPVALRTCSTLMPVCAWNSFAASSHQPWSVEHSAVSCWPWPRAGPQASTATQAAASKRQETPVAFIGSSAVFDPADYRRRPGVHGKIGRMNAAPDLPFRAIAELIREHARARPRHPALRQGDATLDYGALDSLMDRVAAALQRDGLMAGRDTIAICAQTTPLCAAIFLGALRAGIAVAPLAPSVTPQSFRSMLKDAAARWLFVDAAALDALGDRPPPPACISLDGRAPGTAFDAWLAPEGTVPAPVETRPDWPFNIIYSSGTTGTPKGIVQSHAMRWSHVDRGSTYGYGPGTVTLLATPLYSNTTLVVFFPTLAFGGTVVLMAKFDAAAYLALAERHRATHTMLVPVQYQRIMALPDFDRRDLSSFQYKFCTSAPFAAALKADVVARWPGGLVEFYGMTEGGGTCILAAHEHPTKLHTVGQPAAGHDIRLIDDDGRELPPGATGEVVGHSGGMMIGYHGQPAKTAEAEWFDPSGKRFIRTGDVGRFDADGF